MSRGEAEAVGQGAGEQLAVEGMWKRGAWDGGNRTEKASSEGIVDLTVSWKSHTFRREVLDLELGSIR